MRTCRLLSVVATGSFGLIAYAGAAVAQSDDAEFRQQSGRALAALAGTLSRDNLFPIAIPEGQAPGDAYTYSNFWLPESRSTDCFADLKPQVFAWPAIEETGVSETSADGKLSLLKLLNLSGKANVTASVRLTFTDVQSRTVTRQELVRAFRRADCPYLATALEASTVPTPSWFSVNKQIKEKPMIVLHRVVEARRRIVISLLDGAEGGLSVDSPQELIKAVGLGNDPRARFVDGSLALDAKATRNRALIIEDAQRVPVAFTPVSLPSVQVNVLLGSGDPSPVAVAWVPVDAGDNAIAPLLLEWRKGLKAPSE